MCTYESIIFCGENANKHDLYSSTSYLLSFELTIVVIIIGKGMTSFCMFVKTTAIQM